MNTMRSTTRLLAYLDEHFPGERVLNREQLSQASRVFSLSPSTIRQRIAHHGWRVRLGHATAPGPLRAAIAERYPDGTVPRGVSTPLAEEFGVTRQRVSLVIREMGFKVGPSALRTAIAQRYPEGVLPRGASARLAAEFGVTSPRVSVALKEMGFRVGPAAP